MNMRSFCYLNRSTHPKCGIAPLFKIFFQTKKGSVVAHTPQGVTQGKGMSRLRLNCITLRPFTQPSVFSGK